ncbi:MAG: glycerophosphodiester phosphodiesterase [Williamsia sp.]|nr:glycerophosphodiester phosphodiesterase [Williamsia sp.]
MKKLVTVLPLVMLTTMLVAQNKVIREGHRGGRGLMPENTIAAMKKALDLGVQVLELDVVISKDKQVVVSHDTYMSAAFALKPSGQPVSAEEEKTILLYGMPYAEIKKYDVGSRHNQAFARQQNFPAYKPLLSELIDSVELYAKQKGLPPPEYNIEIKSEPQTDNTHHPQPQEFSDLVIGVCQSKHITGRMVIQSFDKRPLQLLHRQHPDIVLSYLTANTKTPAENLQELGFMPGWYSPAYKTVNPETVRFCHEKGVKVVPWTVNTKPEIDALAAMGVDAIISDYPDLF